jgi:hypothetical protein
MGLNCTAAAILATFVYFHLHQLLLVNGLPTEALLTTESQGQTDVESRLVSQVEDQRQQIEQLKLQIDELKTTVRKTSTSRPTGETPILVQQHYSGNAFFQRNWTEFRVGFGTTDYDYWIGNDRLHELTRANGYRVRFDLYTKDRQWLYAEYGLFIVDDESTGYQLHIDNYSGTAGDTMRGFGRANDPGNLNGMKFTTWDRDNDLAAGTNCANYADIIGGFWNRECTWVFINGADCTLGGFGWNTAGGNTFNNLLISRMTLIRK